MRDEDRIYSEFCAKVGKSLVSPRTAIFPTLREPEGAQLFRHDNNVVVVDAFVDSQNSFGALIRSKWRIAAVDSGGELKVFYASIGDKEIGDARDIERIARGVQTVAEEEKQKVEARIQEQSAREEAAREASFKAREEADKAFMKEIDRAKPNER